MAVMSERREGVVRSLDTRRWTKAEMAETWRGLKLQFTDPEEMFRKQRALLVSMRRHKPRRANSLGL